MLETLRALEEQIYHLDREVEFYYNEFQLELKENQQMFDRNTINQLTNIN